MIDNNDSFILSIEPVKIFRETTSNFKVSLLKNKKRFPRAIFYMALENYLSKEDLLYGYCDGS